MKHRFGTEPTIRAVTQPRHELRTSAASSQRTHKSPALPLNHLDLGTWTQPKALTQLTGNRHLSLGCYAHVRIVASLLP
jgi:hypothetical protein